MLLHALRRHLNGYDPKDFSTVALGFFESIRSAQFDPFKWKDPPSEVLLSDKSLDMMIESLEHRVKEGESPNTASFRFVCLRIYPVELD